MASSSNLTTLPLLLLLLVMTSSAQLSTNFYSSSCPNIFKAIKPVVNAAIAKEKRMGASLVRLFFHDCFVNGCDGSILLDDTSNFKGEQHAIPNNNSVRGYEVIGKIKSAVEKVCPGVVSCADIVAVAARDSVVILGGPNWSVKLGRRDSRKASRAAANKNLPPPSSNLTALKSSFKSKGLSEQDLVALSGAHTIGQARCTSFRPHIYNDTNIDKSFAKLRQSNCPATPGSGDNRLSPEDLRTPTVFDNNYYKNLMVLKGQLHSDQELFNKASTDSIVKKYSTCQSTFFSDFVTAMIKMGDVTPLTGTKGEIRKQCGKVN